VLEVAAAGALDGASPTAALQTVGATLATSNPSWPQAVLPPRITGKKSSAGALLCLFNACGLR